MGTRLALSSERDLAPRAQRAPGQPVDNWSNERRLNPQLAGGPEVRLADVAVGVRASRHQRALVNSRPRLTTIATTAAMTPAPRSPVVSTRPATARRGWRRRRQSERPSSARVRARRPAGAKLHARRVLTTESRSGSRGARTENRTVPQLAEQTLPPEGERDREQQAERRDGETGCGARATTELLGGLTKSRKRRLARLRAQSRPRAATSARAPCPPRARAFAAGPMRPAPTACARSPSSPLRARARMLRDSSPAAWCSRSPCARTGARASRISSAVAGGSKPWRVWMSAAHGDIIAFTFAAIRRAGSSS